MKKSAQGFVIIFLLAVVLGGVWGAYRLGFFNPQSSGLVNGEDLNLEHVVAEMQTLEFKIDWISEEDRARLYEQHQEQRAALAVATDAIKNEGDRVIALVYWPLVYLGNTYREAGDYVKAELAYRFASSTQPGAYVPYAALGEMYFRYMNRYEEALPWYDKVFAIQLDDIYAETYYYDVYEIYRFHLNRPGKAEAILLQGIEKHPTAFMILENLAQYYEQTGRTDEAISRYREVLEKNPASNTAAKALSRLTP